MADITKLIPIVDRQDKFKGGREPQQPLIPTLPTPPVNRTPTNSDPAKPSGGK